MRTLPESVSEVPEAGAGTGATLNFRFLGAALFAWRNLPPVNKLNRVFLLCPECAGQPYAVFSGIVLM